MKIEGRGKLLKIFIGESDKWHHEELYHPIIKKINDTSFLINVSFIFHIYIMSSSSLSK